MKRILVLGGTNFVGPRLLPKLLNQGHDLSMVTRGIKENPFKKDVRTYCIDMQSGIDKVRAELAGKSFDVIIDNIAFSAIEVINALSNIDTGRYIQTSSMTVYEKPHDDVREEEFNPSKYRNWKKLVHSTVPYYEGKRQSEAVAYQEYKRTNPVVIRPAYVTDPNRINHPGNSRLWWLVEHVCLSIPIRSGFNHYLCSFTLTSEEADVICQLSDNTYSKPLNVASSGQICIGDLIRYTEEKCGKKAIYSMEGDIPGFTGTDFPPEFAGISLNVERLREIDYYPSKIDEWIWNMMDELIDITISAENARK